MNAGHQIFFHIARARRHVDGQQPRALAGLDRAVVGVEAERARALRCVALSSSEAAGTDGASACSVATSAKTFRSGELARLSVPIAMRTPEA